MLCDFANDRPVEFLCWARCDSVFHAHIAYGHCCVGMREFLCSKRQLRMVIVALLSESCCIPRANWALALGASRLALSRLSR